MFRRTVWKNRLEEPLRAVIPCSYHSTTWEKSWVLSIDHEYIQTL